MNRRQFLKKASLAAVGIAGFPTIIPARALGRSGATAPSNRIVMAGIGFGNMGLTNMDAFLHKGEVQWIAVCDLDEKHLNKARDKVNSYYGNQDCILYRDFREFCLRQDLDAVSIAIPDHWHALVSIACARAGFDIYGEKPLTHSLREGRVLCDAVERYGTMWQTGSWRRSAANFHRAAELVRNGRIGKIRRVELGFPHGHEADPTTVGKEAIEPPPAHLDYDLWLGPAPYAPYCPARVHINWRWNLDYGGGQLMDWVGHHVDTAHWGLGFDTTGPVSIEGKGIYPRSGVWNSATEFYLTATYKGGLPMVLAAGFPEIRKGIKWIGENGWIWCDKDGLEANPPAVLKEHIGPDETHLYKSTDHYQNFLDCVKTRRQTISPCETAHRSASVGHLGNIAMELERRIRFDPETETILDDPEASRLLGRAYRKPWQLDF